MPSHARLCGHLGRLRSFGGAPGELHACFIWHTDLRLLGAAAAASLYDLACEVADLYHRGLGVQLLSEDAELSWARFKVIWLEFTAEDALLVFLQPVGRPQRAPEGGAQRVWAN